MTPRERFLRYVTYYTTSDDFSETAPSTERQKELIRELAREMEELGLKDISFDSNSNVYGTLPANVKGAPSIALIAHVDTAPDAPGENVRPAVIICPEGEFTLESGVVMNEALCPGLSKHVGEELIVTDGTTLLGADDKAGVAEIMSAVERLMESGRPHGEVKVIFTTDEEVGRGAEGIDVKALGCDFGYTVDGGPIGEIEYENFNAASAVLTVHGVGVHPGEAKDVMVNAATVAIEFHDMLPKTEVPENTCGYQGFFHLHDMQGSVTEATLRYIIRDHDAKSFEARKALFLALASEINRRYGEGTAVATVKDSYYNMKEKIEPHIQLIHKAIAAFEKNGIPARTVPIRGGTDGAHLSWDGLPCPNLPTGGYNYHGVREWIPVESLGLMTDVLVDLVHSFAEARV